MTDVLEFLLAVALSVPFILFGLLAFVGLLWMGMKFLVALVDEIDGNEEAVFWTSHFLGDKPK